jgi:acyl dehydratase
VEQIPFDDIDRLKTKISDEFGSWSQPLEVTQTMINQFADLTGDHHWIHVDPERAKRESPFGQAIAHGFLTLSLLPAMKREPDWIPTGFGNATNYGAYKLRFVAPVPAGSKVHSRARLTGVEVHKRGTQVTQELQVNVVGSEKPALIYEMVVLYHPPMG